MRTVNPVNHQRQTRRILDTACALFARRGFARTSMQAIAEACRLTKPTLYHYFRNKSALLDVLLDQRQQELRQVLIDHHQSPDRETRLFALGMAFMDSFKTQRNRDFLQLLLRDSFNEPRVRKLLTDGFNHRARAAATGPGAGHSGAAVSLVHVHQFLGALIRYAVETRLWKSGMIRCGDEAYVRSLALVFTHGLPPHASAARRSRSGPASPTRETAP